MPSFVRLILALTFAVLAAGCATTGDDPRDPFEGFNRGVFDFNDGLDQVLIKPVAEGYRAVTPEVARIGVSNFFGNLRDPWIGLNNLLQGKPENTVNDWARFLFNSTFGFAGLLDWATEMRLEKHNEDFGQTLAVWGVGDGPYLVLPVLGPSNGRDTAGLVADFFAYAPFWLVRSIKPDHWVTWRNSLATLDFVNQRASLLAATDILEQAALDRYAYVRNAYFQRRRNLIYDGNPPPQTGSYGWSPVLGWTEVHEFHRYLRSRDATEAVAGSSAQVVEPRIPVNYDSVLLASALRPRAEP